MLGLCNQDKLSKYFSKRKRFILMESSIKKIISFAEQR
jgi:hypothetical protein